MNPLLTFGAYVWQGCQGLGQESGLERGWQRLAGWQKEFEFGTLEEPEPAHRPAEGVV